MPRDVLIVYQPDNTLKNGYLHTLQQIYDELIDNRWLIYQLFLRDFTTMYKQSFIGFLWIFIIPIINVGIFAMLGHSGIFNFGHLSCPYPVYAILGVSMWQIFSNGVMACGNSLSLAGEMLTRINFSKKSLVIASTGRAIISFLVQIFLVALLFAIYKSHPAMTIVLFPLVALPVIILTLGLGLIVALLNSIVKDTGNLLSVVLMLGMYITPVLYQRPTGGLLAKITTYNPMYYFIEAGRDVALRGSLSDPAGFIWSCLFATFLLILGLVMFHQTETRITERI